jgi:ACS family hexuronate transporter-like MFS transporter
MERLNQRLPAWKWSICGMLFLATMLMYMDRQTLALMIKRISDELLLSNSQYGYLEAAFGFAFAGGAIINGLLADRLSIRWLYPTMLLGWSLAGVATAYSLQIGQTLTQWFPAMLAGAAPDSSEALSQQAFVGLLACRITLGFFESGHWPCALITVQRMLSRSDWTFGNSLLQSGASVGSVLTPLVVALMLTQLAMGWRAPFVVIGIGGMLWIVPWLWLVRNADLAQPVEPAPDRESTNREPKRDEIPLPTAAGSRDDTIRFIRRIAVLLAVVIPINMTWQFFRAWLPKMLQENHSYSEAFVYYFSSAYYLFADIGCIAAGVAVKGLTARRWSLHSARTITFAGCTLLTLLSSAAAFMSAGPSLLAVLLLIGAGSLGMFPIYYSLSQEMTVKRQGIMIGLLGAATWIVSSLMQAWVGRDIEETHSYVTALFWLGQVPILACLALAFFWGRSKEE